MILALAFVFAAATAPDPEGLARYKQCLDLAAAKPVEALTFANQWRVDGGGVPARQCAGLAYLTQKDYAAATATLEGAARAAEAAKDANAGALWGQAGNAALLGDKPAQAMADFNAGLAALAATDTQARADMLIDHARAAAALGQLDTAHDDVTKAVALDPKSADGWLLLATLERGANNLPAAEAAILKANQYGDGDPDVAVEAGFIALAQGKIALARAAWAAVVKVTPDSPAGVTAAKALAAHPG
jgi:tetratricopeptide (TPR) repeat protein